MAEKTQAGSIIGSKEEKTILLAIRKLEKKFEEYHEEARRWHQLIGTEHHKILKNQDP